jgi:hypothetical protein
MIFFSLGPKQRLRDSRLLPPPSLSRNQFPAVSLALSRVCVCESHFREIFEMIAHSGSLESQSTHEISEREERARQGAGFIYSKTLTRSRRLIFPRSGFFGPGAALGKIKNHLFFFRENLLRQKKARRHKRKRSHAHGTLGFPLRHPNVFFFVFFISPRRVSEVAEEAEIILEIAAAENNSI